MNMRVVVSKQSVRLSDGVWVGGNEVCSLQFYANVLVTSFVLFESLIRVHGLSI